ncbi:RDD family protein [Nocardioides sp.]|uniref:RDD family protein n=1 Tax=Nocardioides sp. TaxID=35761 RepID=UPI001A31EB5C|nr:RDD family protein [Nocardioides sp.]MBJ7358563.1 RDD family protein [Nocardioides sp.]
MPATDADRELGFATASWGRRIVALFVDWIVSTLAVIGVVGLEDYSDTGNASGFIVLGVFVVESAVGTALVGGSFGQVATRLRVVPADGSPRNVDPLRSLARQVLIALVIPPLVYRPDGRGLHDIAAGSAVVTLETFRSVRGLA